MPPTCPPNSAVRQPDFVYGKASLKSTGLEIPEVPEGGIGSVIDSFKGYMDVCNSPQYRHFHTSSSWTFPLGQGVVMPFFTPGVHVNFAGKRPHLAHEHVLICDCKIYMLSSPSNSSSKTPPIPPGKNVPSPASSGEVKPLVPSSPSKLPGAPPNAPASTS